MEKTYNKRFIKFQQELLKSGIDIAVLVDRENLIYYTGLTNIECMALVVPASGECVCITLGIDLPFIKKNCAVSNVVGYAFPQSNLGEKLVQVIKEDMGFDSPRVGFSKYFVEFSVFDALRKGLRGMDFVDITDICYRIRSIKDKNEIECIKKASEFLEKGMEAAITSIKPGMTEVQVLAEAQYAMQKSGSEGSTFRMQVLIQKRQLIIHPFAGNYIIDNNQAVVIHLGASYKGYTSKMCRTVALGNVDPETRNIYNVLIRAQNKAIETVKTGVSVGAVYDAAFKVVEDAGYGKNFIDIIGYGVGLRQSEFYPIIRRDGKTIMEKNMVVDLLLPTIYKKEVGGPRITDILQVTDTGTKLLTEFPKEMIQK